MDENSKCPITDSGTSNWEWNKVMNLDRFDLA